MDKKEDKRIHNRSFGFWLGRLLSLPRAAFDYASGKWRAAQTSQDMLETAVPLQLAPHTVARLSAAWMKLASDPSDAVPSYSKEEELIIERIRAETAACNRNNVTRTEAYRTVFFRMPELHWALLAHMVSRNGGWNMTDLQGEWLPRLLDKEQRETVFLFLEQANAYIFQDAYPQLLLYVWSRREDRSLFHLLPAFGVSAFMQPVWKQFWRDRDPVPLTVALIVNEQHYIEQRVVKQPFFRDKVLHTFFFGLQSLLQLNGVIFPYGNELCRAGEEGEREPHLAGLILERFERLEERIELGKQLYAMLFGVPCVREGVKRFAGAVKHTGSRADYAPNLFSHDREPQAEQPYAERLLQGQLKPGAAKLYSPELASAWEDQPLPEPESGDWFESPSAVLPFFQSLPLPDTFEITHEYGLMLSKIELAVLADEQAE